MKILLVNKFHWNKGGSETYYFELGKMLEKYGHEVAYFSMENEKNIKTVNKEYFVSEFDGNGKNIFKAFGTIYSNKNKKIMQKVLREFKPDIVHVNLFQRHLTYSIIDAVKEAHIPIVYTAHDLQAVCPASAMLCHGEICEKCLNKSKYNCLKNNCVKGSKLKSLLSSIEGTHYKSKRVYDKFDMIISPSNFVGNKIREDGIKTEIRTIYNFVDTEKFKPKINNDEKYTLFFGRLSIEKGIINLVKGFSMQSEGMLYIAGDGPEKDNILNYIKNHNLEDRVKLLGFLKQEKVKEYIEGAAFIVVPSIWYENCPYSILEALAMGKPVIGSRIGGIPELIKDDKNGFLYEFEDIERLSMLIYRLFVDKELRAELGENARKIAVEKYSIDTYYKELIKIYDGLVGEGKC